MARTKSSALAFQPGARVRLTGGDNDEAIGLEGDVVEAPTRTWDRSPVAWHRGGVWVEWDGLANPSWEKLEWLTLVDPSSTSTSTRHATKKKSPAQLQREVDEVLAKPKTARSPAVRGGTRGNRSEREIENADLADLVHGKFKYDPQKRARLAYVVEGILRDRGVSTAGADIPTLVVLARAEFERSHQSDLKVGDVVRYLGGYGGDEYVIEEINGPKAKIRSLIGKHGATALLADLWRP